MLDGCGPRNWATHYSRFTSFIQVWTHLRSSRPKESASTINVLFLKKVTFQVWLSGSKWDQSQSTRGIRQASPARPLPSPGGAHTGHTVELAALFFWQDVVQEDPLGPVQLLGVIHEGDVLIEQRATWRDRAHCFLCYLCPQAGKHRTPNISQYTVQGSQFPHEYSEIWRKMTCLEAW